MRTKQFPTDSTLRRDANEGARIRKIRERLGENQTAFGIRFGVVQSAVAKWERFGLPASGPVRAYVLDAFPELKRKRAPSKKKKTDIPCYA